MKIHFECWRQMLQPLPILKLCGNLVHNELISECNFCGTLDDMTWIGMQKDLKVKND